MASHIVYFVFNGVAGDSRVLKTAQSALNAGHRATVVGVTRGSRARQTTMDGVDVVLLPNFSRSLCKDDLWNDQRRDLRLLVGGQLHSAIPAIHSLKPDVLHTHDMIGLKVGASCINAMSVGGRRIPWIHDLHEFVAGLKGGLAETYKPICLEWELESLHTADHLITVSDALATELTERYLLPRRPAVVYNAPRLSDFTAKGPDIRGALGLAESVPLVVFVGGANSLRGCETILQAVSKLPDVHLAFVSSGKYVDTLQEKAVQIGVGPRFHVHPLVEPHQVANFIRSANIGIHGLVHYPNAEVAMPNKLFEYLHAGLPTVVSDVMSMKNFVERYRIGTSFVAEDVDSCARSIERSLENRDYFEKNITDTLKREYSWESQESQLIRLYNLSLLNRAKPLSLEERDRALLSKRLDVMTYETTYLRALWQGKSVNQRAERPLSKPSQQIAEAKQMLLDGRIIEAEQLLNDVLARKGACLVSMRLLAKAAVLRRDWPVAADRWQKVEEICLQDSNIEAGRKRELTEAASRSRSKALARCSPSLLLDKAKSLIKADKIPDAEPLLECILAKRPSHIGALALSARAAASRRDWSTAADRWQKLEAACLQDSNMEAGRKRQLIETASRSRSKALARCSPSLILDKAKSLIKADKIPDAEPLLECILAKRPSHIGALALSARAAASRRDWSTAVDRWQKLEAACLQDSNI